LPLPAHNVRFGPFQLDLRTAELKNNGVTTKLAEQPFQILAELVQHPGEVVTRDELRQRLWQSDTFGDFEHGLSAAVGRLREVLGDSAESPRYIETVPRRGYRLMIPVENLPTALERSGQVAPTALKQAGPKNLARWRKCSVIAACLIMALAALGTWYLRSGMAARPIESLAVLPVKDFSGDPSQEFFADGMTDALVAGLSQIKAVKVISRTSVMHYKGTSETVPQIAKELGVDGIVEVSIMRSGDRLRLTAQLIDARQDRHLWADSYERSMTDVLALQSDLVQAIAAEIKVQITPQESARLKAARPVDPEVYADTLKGTTILEYATNEGQFRQAIELFQKATDRDPTYAPAWAGLGEALWSLAVSGFEVVAPAEVRGRATAAADRALELDENLHEAHKARAVIAFDGDWDIEKAQQHFERALELRPGYAAAHNLYGQVLTIPLARPDEARRHLDWARELDPLSPWNDFNLLYWSLYQGRPEKELEEGHRLSLQQNPTFLLHAVNGGALLALGQPSRAIVELEAELEVDRPVRLVPTLASLGLAYGLVGRRTDALKILRELEEASKKRYVSPYYIAIVYSGLGQMDKAFRLLEQALATRSTYLVIGCAPVDPCLNAFRRDPRWKSFIARFRQQVRLPPGTPNPYS
jgi:TolB-like protein/DNA-binding winged helix-turn-helix (wHTH) protein/Tfp pilus assembly protein PilF